MATANGDTEDMRDVQTPYEVEEDEACGRFLVASKSLEQGDLILSEKPTGNTVGQE